MKLISFELGGQETYGAVTDAGVIDLGKRLRGSGAATLRALLEAGRLAEALALAASTAPDMPMEGLTLLPVIPDPRKILCVGLNYHDHVQETGNTVTEKPTIFSRYPVSQVGHLRPIVKPLESDSFDFEGELAVIIGTGGRRISEADALSHIAGYSCYNEGTIRDWQRHTKQYLPGKSFAQTGALGPWMVTADEIPDPTKLTLETRVNGAVMQHATTDLMITSVRQIIAYCSTVFPLEPGDVIATGTPGGVGARREPPVWLKAGDVVEIEISGIGVLRNPVIAEG